jgi:hypothetical protein
MATYAHHTTNDYTTNDTTSQQDIDTLAREYIRSLEKGIMPEDRPDSFEEWEIYIGEIERFFFDHERDKDLPKKMAEHIRNYCKDHQDLARLLRRSTNQEDIDQAAREYILSFKKGVFPFDRLEDFGQWESVIAQIESFWTRTHGDKEKLSDMIDSLCKFKTELKELLEDYDDTEQGGEKEASSFVELPEKARISPEASRGACQWLNDYVEFSKEASPEGFEDFHPFVGMWVLSVVHARRSYIPMKKKKYYGNLNIVLCAITSTAAKSHTAAIGTQLLAEAGLSYMLGAQKTTPEKLVNSMSGNMLPRNYHQLSDEKKEFIRRKIAMSGQKGLYRDEFGKFIREVLKKESADSGWIEFLLKIYDCPPDYDAETISRGSDKIYNPYIALLGAMTYPDIKRNGKSGSDFWRDGFWARFGFIAAPSNYNKIATLDVGEEMSTPFHLLRDLTEWNSRLGMPQCEIVAKQNGKGDVIEGEYEIAKDDDSFPCVKMTISQEANLAYKRYREALKELFPQFKHQDFNGSYDRLPEQALRMAVLMASLENNNHIDFCRWAKAQELAELLRRSLHRMYDETNGGVISDSARMEQEILEEGKKFLEKGVTSAVLCNRCRKLSKYGATTLQERLDKMWKAGILSKTITDRARGGVFKIV